MPKVYLGWCTELQEKAQRFELIASTMEDGKGAWFVANNETLEKYRRDSAEDIVRELWIMYSKREPRSLVKFEDILKAVIEFHTAWAVMKGRLKAIGKATGRGERVTPHN